MSGPRFIWTVLSDFKTPRAFHRAKNAHGPQSLSRLSENSSRPIHYGSISDDYQSFYFVNIQKVEKKKVKAIDRVITFVRI